MIRDLTDMRFGRWTVKSIAGRSKANKILWNCVCDCGTEKAVVSGNLTSGISKSCGCLKEELTTERNKLLKSGKAYHQTHGLKAAHPRLYDVWCSMRSRCNNRSNKRYSDYGGRGIKVCNEWNDFSKFADWAYASGYQDDAERGKFTVDRIDNDKGYSPDNCRLVDYAEQSRNRRHCKTCLIHKNI